jgi:hypothetical protein
MKDCKFTKSMFQKVAPRRFYRTAISDISPLFFEIFAVAAKFRHLFPKYYFTSLSPFRSYGARYTTLCQKAIKIYKINTMG